MSSFNTPIYRKEVPGVANSVYRGHIYKQRENLDRALRGQQGLSGKKSTRAAFYST